MRTFLGHNEDGTGPKWGIFPEKAGQNGDMMETLRGHYGDMPGISSLFRQKTGVKLKGRMIEGVLPFKSEARYSRPTALNHGLRTRGKSSPLLPAQDFKVILLASPVVIRGI